MFAGGRASQSGQLRIGAEATRRTWQASSSLKNGRSGPLYFVTVRSEISQGGQVVVTEEQDLVYREPAENSGQPSAAAADPQRPPPGSREWQVEVSPVLLFRFSALTYNAHRIHYDQEYARAAEGYPGLVVHGPLQVLLMAELARREAARPAASGFSYRLVAPLFEGQGLIVSVAADGQKIHVMTRDSADRTTAVGVIH
jgi:3-methylfumaryl-CoA hydratase